MRLIILFFYLTFSTFLIAENTKNKQDYVIDEDAKVRESTDELIVREITIDPETHPGNALYQDNCAICHDGSIEKAPAGALKLMQSVIQPSLKVFKIFITSVLINLNHFLK